MRTRDGFAVRPGLLKGAAILGLAALISKLLGTLQKIPLQNIAGDGVFGIYNAVYPFYFFMLVITTAGFPIAISAFVSERVARDEYGEARRVLRIALVMISLLGFITFLLLFTGAKTIASLIGVPSTARAIQSVSFALLIVPPMAVLRGYFQGLQNMMPTATSQIAEQTIRVGTMVWLLVYFVQAGYGEEWIAAGAIFGSVTGSAAGLLVMALYWWGHQKHYHGLRKKEPDVRIATLSLVKKFAAYVLPISLGAIVLPTLNLVDSFTVPRLLQLRGADAYAAIQDFGIYNRGIPLVQLVALIATSMAAALVPAIAEAKEHGRYLHIQTKSELAVRMTWFISLAASFGLAVTALPLNIMFYKTPDGTLTMMILSMTAVFSTMSIVTGSILQGLGIVFPPAIHMLIATAVKLGANMALVPTFGIDGAAVSGVIAFAVAASLNMLLIRKHTGVMLSSRANILKPSIAIVFMCLSIFAFMLGMEMVAAKLSINVPYRMKYAMIALGSIGVGVICYLAALFRMKAVTTVDLEMLTKHSSRIISLLAKLRWIDGGRMKKTKG